MCIVLVSTLHPDYPFILLNNRDEYLTRPTAPAAWWNPPHDHVLGGRDLYRSVQGTWLGMTRQGRLAVLTNFREEGDTLIEGARSRGELPNAFLTPPPGAEESLEEFAHRLIVVEGVHGIGGFILAFGMLRRKTSELEGQEEKGALALVSNRTPNVKGVEYSHPKTWGLSNSHYGDRAWPKVVDGEKFLDRAIEESVSEKQTEGQFIERCFGILSTNTLPERDNSKSWDIFVREMRNSIFIPALGSGNEDVTKKEGDPAADELAAARGNKPINKATSGLYGTQKQTVILVNRDGKVKYVERTLYDQDAKPLEKDDRDRVFEFDIEGWD